MNSGTQAQPRKLRGFTLDRADGRVAIIALMSAIGAFPSHHRATSSVSLTSATARRWPARSRKPTTPRSSPAGASDGLRPQGRRLLGRSRPPTVLLDTKESREREERKKRLASDRTRRPGLRPSRWTRASPARRSRLPTGVTFEDIMTQQSPEPVTEGMAYTHFFPHGMIEQTMIHLKDSPSTTSRS